jgi:hypothetical protein
MIRFLSALCVCLLLGACATVSVTNPDGDPADFSGLRDIVKGGKPLTLIFVHGVNDHCRGYAVPPTDSSMKGPPWMDLDSLAQAGLVWKETARLDSVITVGDADVNGPDDRCTPVIDLRQVDYDVETHYADNVSGDVQVRAVEIT